jgi:hypothetical protein
VFFTFCERTVNHFDIALKSHKDYLMASGHLSVDGSIPLSLHLNALALQARAHQYSLISPPLIGSEP